MRKPLHRTLWWFSYAGLVVFGAVFSTSCSGEQLPVIPRELAGMRIRQQLSGAGARQMIDHLHGKEITPQENHVVVYGGQQHEATLYVSVYTNEFKAQEMLGNMARRVGAGNPVFTDYEEFSMSGREVSRCAGMGQVHYFFVRGRMLCWLAADPPVAETAVASLLRAVEN